MFGHTNILHTLVGTGGAAPAAAVPRYGEQNFPQRTKKCEHTHTHTHTHAHTHTHTHTHTHAHTHTPAHKPGAMPMDAVWTHENTAHAVREG